MPPKTPLPFVNVKPAVRVGICSPEWQDCDKPLGSNPLSFCYSSTGKLVTDSKTCQNENETYRKLKNFPRKNFSVETGDVIGVLITRAVNARSVASEDHL